MREPTLGANDNPLSARRAAEHRLALRAISALSEFVIAATASEPPFTPIGAAATAVLRRADAQRRAREFLDACELSDEPGPEAA